MLSFLKLVLLIMRPFVTSGMFVSPILVKATSVFLFTALLGQKWLDRFRFFLEDMATA